MSLRLRPDIFGPLLEDRARFVVVDEAHHAVAGSYRHVLDGLLARPHRRILGLTATPTRTAERERPALARMFGQRPPLYEVSLGRLIELGILARPRPVTVETNADVESLAVEKNREHLRKFHDIDEDWLAKSHEATVGFLRIAEAINKLASAGPDGHSRRARGNAAECADA